MAMRPPSLRGQRVREGRGPRSERAMRFGQRHRAEAQALARFHLSQAADVERTDRPHPRLTAGGLAVDEQRDGLTIAGDLDAPEGETVREGIVPGALWDAGSLQALAHAG